MKTIASGILSTMALGLIGGVWGMFMTQQELKANDMLQEHTNKEVIRRLEKIERKNDVIIEMLLKRKK